MKIRVLLLGITLLLSIINAATAQTSNLGGKIVSRSEYEAALPFIDTDRLRIRDYPSTENGNTIAVLEQDAKVNLYAKTLEMDTIDGSERPWYQVQLRGDTKIRGWVFGKYLGFRDKYPEEFWNPTIISRLELNRQLFVRNTLSMLLNAEKGKVDDEWLDGKTPAETFEPGIWYLKSLEGRIYQTDFGEVAILYDADDTQNVVSRITIDMPTTKLDINVGDDREKLELFFGKYYRQDDNTLSFFFDEYQESYYIRIALDGEKIVEIDILKFFT